MLNEKELKERRESIVARIQQLDGASSEVQEQLQQIGREGVALRGQVQLIDEMLGDTPPPPGAAQPPPGPPGEKPPPKPKRTGAPRKRSKAHGR